jgi:hypothetical protein
VPRLNLRGDSIFFEGFRSCKCLGLGLMDWDVSMGSMGIFIANYHLISWVITSLTSSPIAINYIYICICVCTRLLLEVHLRVAWNSGVDLHNHHRCIPSLYCRPHNTRIFVRMFHPYTTFHYYIYIDFSWFFSTSFMNIR